MAFTVNKFVLLGASITDQVFSSDSVRDVVKAWVSSEYAVDIELVERATGGWGVGDLRSNIDAILADYDAEPGTHYLLHIGGNNISVGTPFRGLDDVVQAQHIADLEYIYDAVATQGRELLQSSLTFRNYGGDTLDLVPTQKSKELDGSYTYIRDWIVPVMLDKAPDYLVDSWPILDAYNVTRNKYAQWSDGVDVVHPNDYARIFFAMELVEKAVRLSLGLTTQGVTPLDFSAPRPREVSSGVTLAYTSDDTILAGTDNVNWGYRELRPTDTPQTVRLESMLNSVGGKSEVGSFSYFTNGGVGVGGNSSDPANMDSALSNDKLLTSYLSAGASTIYAMLDGLTPLARYGVSAVSARAASSDFNKLNFDGQGYGKGPGIGNILTLSNLRVEIDNVTWASGEGYIVAQRETFGSTQEFGFLQTSNSLVMILGGTLTTLRSGLPLLDKQQIILDLNPQTGEYDIVWGGVRYLGTTGVGTARQDNTPWYVGARGATGGTALSFMLSGDSIGDMRVYADGVLVRNFENPAVPSSTTIVDTVGGADLTLTDFLSDAISIDTSVSNSEQLNNIYIDSATPSTIDISSATPEDNIVTSNATADYLGRIYVGVVEDNTTDIAVINGLRVNESMPAGAYSKITVINGTLTMDGEVVTVPAPMYWQPEGGIGPEDNGTAVGIADVVAGEFTLNGVAFAPRSVIYRGAGGGITTSTNGPARGVVY